MKGVNTVRGERRKHRTKSQWILCIAVIVFILYIAVTIVEQQIQISNAQEQLTAKQHELEIQKIKTQELKAIADAVDTDNLDSFSDYIEQTARQNFDYVKSGELVFINIAGD